MKMNVGETLKVMGEIHGKNMSPAAAIQMASDLSEYDEDAVLSALKKCRFEIPRFPTMAEIIARIDDGHPTPEIAWGMVPRSEMESVVWTEEMRAAYSDCSSLIDEDEVAARMAFKESYVKRLSDARLARKAPKWVVSLGQDKAHREVVIREAIEKNRLTAPEAQKLLPHTAFQSEVSVKQILGSLPQMKSIENKEK